MSDEEALLTRMGIDFHSPSPGCCGMAGSFGFEHDKYDVSTAIGELELLPAVRHTDPNDLIIADGFSCREQIAQATDRRALHLAEVLQMALKNEVPINGHNPETPAVRRREAEIQASMRRAGWGVAAAIGAGALLWSLTRRR
jgi:hypothetical protein